MGYIFIKYVFERHEWNEMIRKKENKVLDVLKNNIYIYWNRKWGEGQFIKGKMKIYVIFQKMQGPANNCVT